MRPLDGWERFPENLDQRGSNTYGYDCQAYNEQLAGDSERLFVSGDRFCIKVVEVGEREQCFENLNGLQDYLESSATCRATRLILIPQAHSWGKLVISPEAIRKLFTYFTVYPAVIDILCSFGEKTNYDDDSYSSFRFRADELSETFETSYVVKHVEEHGRKGPEDPWSIRQIGVYHRADPGGGNTFFVLNPSKSFQRKLKRAKELSETPTPWEIHMMLLSSAMEKWRWYISDLEKRYVSKKTRAQLSNVKEEDISSPRDDIRFEDTQDIQVLQDKLHQTSHCLTMNRYILQEIQPKQRHFSRLEDQRTQAESYFAASLATEASMELARLDAVLKRVEGTLALVRAILDFRCLASLQHNSRNMTKMTELSQEENAMMVKLTRKASLDADTLKTLTLLTLVYLPASLISSMMGMNYVKVENKNRTISFHIAGEFWIFLVLTIILLVLTLGSYFWWQRRRRPSPGKVYKYDGGYELETLV